MTNKTSTSFGKKLSLTLALFLGVLNIKSVASLENGLGMTPPMGWNTWNRYYCDIN